MTGSDAVGLVMGYYDTTQLPIYKYLHSKGHPDYVIADNFFQSAFGGSFLNHQWLVAAATPAWSSMPAGQHAIVDTNGMPNNYPLYHATGPVADPAGTIACGTAPTTLPHLACGDYAVNTIQPTYQPTSSNPVKLPPLSNPTIGDRLSAAGVSWAWYSGGWSNADGDVGAPGWTNGPGPTCSDPDSSPNPTYPHCPNKVFQFHHQPLNYYATFAPGTPGRTHLRDEVEFQQLVSASNRRCQLNSVSFIKPIGLENEHPGYTSVNRGSDHLVDLISSIEGSACARDTMIVVTYDEFGGQWDHVAPPGQGGAPGPHDQWGPGTRIPALIVSRDLHGSFGVDHTAVRHDVDPGHDRAPLRPPARRDARRAGERPLRRLRSQEAEARRGRLNRNAHARATVRACAPVHPPLRRPRIRLFWLLEAAASVPPFAVGARWSCGRTHFHRPQGSRTRVHHRAEDLESGEGQRAAGSGSPGVRASGQ